MDFTKVARDWEYTMLDLLFPENEIRQLSQPDKWTCTWFLSEETFLKET